MFGDAPSFGIAIQPKKITNKGGAASLHWQYERDGKNGWINLTNPYQGILVIGGAGAGKSYTVAEPMIDQFLAQGFTGFLYDFKFPVLCEYMIGSFARNVKADDKRRLCIVNFKDMSRTHRVNPINPRYLKQSTMAEELANAFATNLNPESIQKKDFWITSAINLFAGGILALAQVAREYPEFKHVCTLPHVIELVLNNAKVITKTFQKFEEASSFGASLRSAVSSNAESQIGGVMGSVQNPIAKMRTKETYWVLSGDDVPLDLNNPELPTVLCVANDPEMQSALSPIISLIATCVMKQINQQNKQPSFFMLDEAPTLFIPNLQNLPATARSNRVSTVVMAQDFSQMDMLYGKEQARALVGNLGNQFFGMVNDTETANKLSQVFGKAEKEQISTSKGKSSGGTSSSNSYNTSYSKRDAELMPASRFTQFFKGEFAGKVTKANASDIPFFHGNVLVDHLKDSTKYAFNPLNNLSDSEVTNRVLSANMKKIQLDVIRIIRDIVRVDAETGDPL